MDSYLVSSAIGASAAVAFSLTGDAPSAKDRAIGTALGALAGAVAGVALYILATTGILSVMAFAAIGACVFGAGASRPGDAMVGAIFGAALGAFLVYALPGPDAVAIYNGTLVPIYKL